MTRSLTWADLFATGSLVDLDVSMWDGLVRLRPEDLGIPATDEVKRALTFGHERLVGKAALQEIRDHCYNARRKIDDYTLAFDLIPGSRFIPRSQREDLHKFLEDAHGKFQAAVNKFLAGYAEERRRQEDVLRKALLAATNNNAEVVARAMTRIIALYPGEATLRYKFAMTWRFFAISAPQDGTASDGQAEGDALKKSLGDMIDKLRERLAEKVHTIVDLAQKGGRITAKTYNSANKLLDRLVTLNVFGDPGLSETISSVRLALNTAQSSEDGAAASLINGLQGIESEMAKSRDDAIKAVSSRIVGMAERRMQL